MWKPIQFVFLGVILACLLLVSSALKVGETANSDKTCEAQVNKTTCTREFFPICAKLRGKYLKESNICNFCSKYGNTNALILQQGFSKEKEFRCEPLKVEGLANDDPECVLFSGSAACTREFSPICAMFGNGTYVNGSNKCDFCSQYGNMAVHILSLGTEEEEKEFVCSPLKVGSRANNDPACFNLAKSKQYACPRNLSPICAKLDNGTLVTSDNECFFCNDYGDTSATVQHMAEACPNDTPPKH